ncbi:MAG: polyhydroxyalkanoate synthesis repressor PhaR [Candidatus Berkiella sp.]
MMSEPRIIKKYPNRRLYDTAISSYITLEDVRRLVVDQVSIKVIDARTQNDITHSTLLQIIIEQEENGPPMFSIDSLQNMIRSYGGSMQEMLSQMFEQGVELFSKQQTLFKSCLAQGVPQPQENADPLRLMTEMLQKNMSNWQQIQHQWMESFVAKETQRQESMPDDEPMSAYSSEKSKETE